MSLIARFTENARKKTTTKTMIIINNDKYGNSYQDAQEGTRKEES